MKGKPNYKIQWLCIDAIRMLSPKEKV